MWPFNNSKTSAAPQTASKTPSLEELSYAVAYFVLPHYAFKDLDKAVESLLRNPIPAM